MGIFTNRDNKKRYCVFCGKELADGKCTACGREAKEVVSLSSLNWQKVPMEVADALGEQKKQLFGNPLYTVKEMIINGDLFIADINLTVPTMTKVRASIRTMYSFLPRSLPRATGTARRRLVSMTGWRSC